MHVGVAAAGLVDAGDLRGGEDADGDFLRYGCFARGSGSGAADAGEVEGGVRDVGGGEVLACAVVWGRVVAGAFDAEGCGWACGAGEGGGGGDG